MSRQWGLASLARRSGWAHACRLVGCMASRGPSDYVRRPQHLHRKRGHVARRNLAHRRQLDAPARGLHQLWTTSLRSAGPRVAFTGNYAGGSGVYLASASGLTAILNTGDVLFGSTLTAFNVSNYGFDNNVFGFSYSPRQRHRRRCRGDGQCARAERTIVLAALSLVGLGFAAWRKKYRRAWKRSGHEEAAALQIPSGPLVWRPFLIRSLSFGRHAVSSAIRFLGLRKKDR